MAMSIALYPSDASSSFMRLVIMNWTLATFWAVAQTHTTRSKERVALVARGMWSAPPSKNFVKHTGRNAKEKTGSLAGRCASARSGLSLVGLRASSGLPARKRRRRESTRHFAH